jgi:hypothetical protein
MKNVISTIVGSRITHQIRPQMIFDGSEISANINIGREHSSVQHWVLCKCGLTNKHHPIANPSCGSGWTNNFQL